MRSSRRLFLAGAAAVTLLPFAAEATPGELATATAPRWRSITAFTIDNPSPLPVSAPPREASTL